jgi:RNA polymerase sigma-70 factor, ECF subfamily
LSCFFSENRFPSRPSPGQAFSGSTLDAGSPLQTATLVESDEDLAARAAGGCRASFAALIERHYDRIYRLAWRWSGSRDKAEDIAQDVCVKLAAAIRGYRGDAAFTTWLHRIAYTTAIDHLRSGQRMTAVEPSEIIRLIDSEIEYAAPDDSSGQDIWVAVLGLPPQQRDSVLLIYGEDMSHAEAATVMGCSEKTVSWHVHEAKKKLKILLKAVG